VSGVVAVFVVLASACTVAGGLVWLTRGLFHLAVDLRDNKNATLKNTEALRELATHVDGRMDAIEKWIVRHDSKRGNP
jgi:hypothetical protein